MDYFRINNLIDAKLKSNQTDKIRVLLINASARLMPFPGIQQGIGILAGICEVNNVFVRCIDYSVTNLDLNYLGNYIRQNQFNLVGISSTTNSINTAHHIVRYIKNLDKSIFTIMGGSHVSELPQESLENGADVIFIGESELQFIQFLNQFLDITKDTRPNRIAKLKEIKGIAFLDDTGKITFTGKNDRIIDLDLIPFPARHYFPYPNKYKSAFRAFRGHSARILTSRGCNYYCFFCTKNIFSKMITFRSPENVIQEINYILTNFKGIKQIDFVDEYFLYDLDRIIRISNLINKHYPNIEWAAGNTRIDSNISLDFFKLLKKCGCYRIAFGVESGSQRVVNNINKKIDLGYVKKIVELANKAGLFTACFFIIGNHCETEEEIKETIQFAKKLPCDAMNFNINTPYPGSPLWNYLLKKDLITEKNWDKFGEYKNIAFKHEYVSQDKLLLYYRKAYREFYLRPEYFFRQLKKYFTTKARYWYLYYSGLLQTFNKL